MPLHARRGRPAAAWKALGPPRREVRDEVGPGGGVRLHRLRVEARLEEGPRQEAGAGVEVERSSRDPGPRRAARHRARLLEEGVEEEPVRLKERGDRDAEARPARLERERPRPQRGGQPSLGDDPDTVERTVERGGDLLGPGNPSLEPQLAEERRAVAALEGLQLAFGHVRYGERFPHCGEPRKQRFRDDLARDEIRDL